MLLITKRINLMVGSNFQRGISLSEVLVSAALFGILIMAVTPMITYAFRMNYLAKERSGATHAAQQIIEEVQRAGFVRASTLVNKATTQAVLPDDLQGQKLYLRGDGKLSKTPDDGGKLLQVQRIYNYQENDEDTIADDTIQVTVKISWPGHSGESITMGATLARHEL